MSECKYFSTEEEDADGKGWSSDGTSIDHISSKEIELI